MNLEEKANLGGDDLSPIQIRFRSDKFSLPIRLGMANAKGSQDMIVYAFSDQGRITATNYRTVEIPTDMNIPEFIQAGVSAFLQKYF